MKVKNPLLLFDCIIRLASVCYMFESQLSGGREFPSEALAAPPPP